MTHQPLLKSLPLLSALLALGACGADHNATPAPAPASAATASATAAASPVVKEAFITASAEADNIDSVATWHAPDGSARLYATAKHTDAVRVYDAETGKPLGSIGSPGSGAGQLSRPNGIAVIDDRLFVVERDNHRVQVFALPDGKPLGSFGADVLKKPYGLWIRAVDGGYDVDVTDDWMAEGTSEADAHKRVLRFRVGAGESLDAQQTGAFGEADGTGRLHVVESIWGDPVHDNLLVAEEYEADGSRLKLFDLKGNYRGRDVGNGIYRHQAEGIALYACTDGRGYWIGSDQSVTDQRYLVFDRVSFDYLGALRPAEASNTDGVWLDQRATARFPAGAFYVAHNDHAVAAFDWRDIAKPLKLRTDCTLAP